MHKAVCRWDHGGFPCTVSDVRQCLTCGQYNRDSLLGSPARLVIVNTHGCIINDPCMGLWVHDGLLPRLVWGASGLRVFNHVPVAVGDAAVVAGRDTLLTKRDELVRALGMAQLNKAVACAMVDTLTTCLTVLHSVKNEFLFSRYGVVRHEC